MHEEAALRLYLENLGNIRSPTHARHGLRETNGFGSKPSREILDSESGYNDSNLGNYNMDDNIINSSHSKSTKKKHSSARRKI